MGVSFGSDDGSAMRQRLAGAFDQFNDVSQMSDHAAGALLDGLDLDIAIESRATLRAVVPNCSTAAPRRCR